MSRLSPSAPAALASHGPQPVSGPLPWLSMPPGRLFVVGCLPQPLSSCWRVLPQPPYLNGKPDAPRHPSSSLPVLLLIFPWHIAQWYLTCSFTVDLSDRHVSSLRTAAFASLAALSPITHDYVRGHVSRSGPGAVLSVQRRLTDVVVATALGAGTVQVPIQQELRLRRREVRRPARGHTACE